MSFSVDTTAHVDENHNLILNLPDVPPGRVHVVATVDSTEVPLPMTAAEFANSEFFGMWADRDDLPSTNEEFVEWRRKLWERSSE